MRKNLLFAAIAVLGFSNVAFAQKTHLFNPAEDKASGGVNRHEEDAAWFGEYAGNDQAYNPIFLGDITLVTGDPVIVWARVRGFAVQAKAVSATGAQTELDWAYDAPKDWKWEKIGSYSHTQLGAKVLLIRGPTATPNAGLNAVILTTDPSLNPDALTEAALEAQIKGQPAPATAPAAGTTPSSN